MKVYQTVNYPIYRQNFNGKYKSPVEIENTCSLLKNTIWYKSENPFPDRYGKRASELLNEITDMTGTEYSRLTQKQKYILDKVIPESIIRDANRNYDIACALGKYLEEHFGNFKNYTILSIGRSLATCCEALRHMGADIKFIPLSGLRKNPCLDDITPKGVSIYEKYLTSIGLTKEQIRNNPTHKYIIMDYTATGNSLRNAHEFLTLDELLSDAPNIETLSTEESLCFNHNGMLSGELLKVYSPVKQLQPRELENVFEAADPYKYDYHNYRNSSNHIRTKLFRLRMFELLDSNNRLKELS